MDREERLRKKRESQKIYYRENSDYYKEKAKQRLINKREHVNTKRRENHKRKLEEQGKQLNFDTRFKKTIPEVFLKDLQEFAKLKEGECLSKEYKGLYHKVEWKCKNNHKWFAKPYNVLQKNQWCSICAGKKANNHLKINFEEIRKLAKNKEGECLSQEEEYININSKLKWKCKHGHEWYASVGSIKNNNSWCPYCPLGFRENFCRFLFETYTGLKFPKMHPKWLKNEETKRNLELDGYNEEYGIAFEYNGEQHYSEDKNFFHRDKELFETQKYRDDVKKQKCEEKGVKLCIVPYHLEDDQIIQYIEDFLTSINFTLKVDKINVSDFKNEKYSKQEEFKKLVESIGYDLLSEYRHCDQKVKVRCKNNHIWDVHPRAIKNGNRCPFCSKKAKYNIKDIREKAKENGLELLTERYKNNSQNLELKCVKCGKKYLKRVIEVYRNLKCCE